MNTAPRYLRFVRALALTSLGATGACAASVDPAGDATAVVDAAVCRCRDFCSCFDPDASASLPVCTSQQMTALDASCAVTGPLSPPELRA